MNPQWPNDFESIGRQYMEAWQSLMRGAVQGPPAPPPGFSGFGGWHDPTQAWARTAAQFAQPDAMASMHRFNAQSNGWYARMHELAAKFADQATTAKTITDEWRRMLEGQSGNMMADALKTMQSGGSQGFDAWYASVEPMLNAFKQEFSSWLSVPAFGLAREHQERLQKLVQSQLAYQEAVSAHNALLGQSGEAALKHFEALLEKQGDAGKPITSARALFDAWVEAAEQAYSKVALSREYRKAYADMVNAQMRLRAGMQHEVEHACDLLGIPTRTEMDAAHRKIAELERALRRMRTPSGNAPAAAAGSRRGDENASQKARKGPVSAKKGAHAAATAKNSPSTPPSSARTPSRKRT